MARPCSLAIAMSTATAFGQQWEQLPDFPGTARDDAASFTIGHVIHVGTGMEVGWGLTNDWYAFDVGTEAWAPIASLPSAPRQYCTAFTADGRGYLFGGTSSAGALNELWMYDPATGDWQQRASLPGPGRYASVSYVRDGLAYVQGGVLADGAITDELWMYGPINDEWMLLDFALNSPLPARHRSAVVQVGQYNIIAGGIDAQGGTTTSTHMQLGPGHEYMGGVPLPAPRFGARGTAGVLIGGASTWGTEHDEVWMLDVANGWWDQSLPSFAGGPRRAGIAASVIEADMRLVHYGLGLHGSERFKDWWVLALPVGIVELDPRSLALRPNPATHDLHLTFDALGPYRYRIADGLGRTVLSGPIAPEEPIDISSLPAGQYTVHALARTALCASFIKLP